LTCHGSARDKGVVGILISTRVAVLATATTAALFAIITWIEHRKGISAGAFLKAGWLPAFDTGSYIAIKVSAFIAIASGALVCACSPGSHTVADDVTDADARAAQGSSAAFGSGPAGSGAAGGAGFRPNTGTTLENMASGGRPERADAGAGNSITGNGGNVGAAAGRGGSTATTAQKGFSHPGLLITSSDISRMKEKISARLEPFYTSYTTLLNDEESKETKAVEPPPAIVGRNSASAYASTRYAAEAAAVTAFQNALVFVLTGETPHAAKTVAILNAYASATQHFDKVDPERDLEAAILGWLFVSSAELVRYSDYNGWTPAEMSQFSGWIRNVVYADTEYEARGVLVTPLVNGAGARGAFGLRTKLAIGIYLDDKTIFGEAVDYFFHGKGNGAPEYYVNPTTGQTWEAGRDQGHAQGGLSRLVETAHMAYNQGDPSLYAWKDYALRRAVEYIASYNLGNEVPYSAMQPYTVDWADVYDTISSEGRGKFATIYELPYSYFHDILSQDMPYAKQVLALEGTETFSAQNDNPMFATLTYRR
jgi:hypothetical protein